MESTLNKLQMNKHSHFHICIRYCMFSLTVVSAVFNKCYCPCLSFSSNDCKKDEKKLSEVTSVYSGGGYSVSRQHYILYVIQLYQHCFNNTYQRDSCALFWYSGPGFNLERYSSTLGISECGCSEQKGTGCSFVRITYSHFYTHDMLHDLGMM